MTTQTPIKAVYIYALFDPITTACRYVGKSTNPFRRFIEHVAACKKDKYPFHVYRWMKQLAVLNKKPLWVILEKTTVETWQARERWWIKTLREKGEQLTNLTNGGDGNKTKGFTGGKHSSASRAKMRRAHAERPALRTPAQKLAMAEWNRKHKIYKPHSAEVKQRIASSLRGRPAPNKGKKMSQQQKDKISSGLIKYYENN